MRLIVALLLALLLAGCKQQIQIIPPWYSPFQDHSLECKGNLDTGECSKRLMPGEGPL